MDRRSFIGAAVAAVMGLAGFGLTSKRARAEIVGSKRETVKADQLPPVLGKFNNVGTTHHIFDNRLEVIARRPASDLRQSKVRQELSAERYVQGHDGECYRLRPMGILWLENRAVYWNAKLTAV